MLRTFILLALLAAPVSARDLFVNNRSGDDVNDGTTETNEGGKRGPTRSLGMALYIASPGDRIVLANTNTPYLESVTVWGGHNSGIAGRPFVIDGNGATLDGSREIPSDQWQRQGGGVFRYDPYYKAYQNLFIDATPVERVVGDPESKKRPELGVKQWCLHRGSMYFRVEDDKTPRGHHLRFAALPAGITLYEVRDVVIKDLTVQGFRLDGVNAHNDARDVVLNGVKLRGNGRSGLSVGGSSRVDASSCLVGNNGVVQVRTEGSGQVDLKGCDVIGVKTAPAHESKGGKLLVDGKLPAK